MQISEYFALVDIGSVAKVEIVPIMFTKIGFPAIWCIKHNRYFGELETTFLSGLFGCLGMLIARTGNQETDGV